jgi:hypothetical protein
VHAFLEVAFEALADGRIGNASKLPARFSASGHFRSMPAAHTVSIMSPIASHRRTLPHVCEDQEGTPGIDGYIYMRREGAQSVDESCSPISRFPERRCMTDLKGSRAQSRLQKSARETGNAGLYYEVQARAVREKIARLRELRIAKEMDQKIRRGA